MRKPLDKPTPRFGSIAIGETLPLREAARRMGWASRMVVLPLHPHQVPIIWSCIFGLTRAKRSSVVIVLSGRSTLCHPPCPDSAQGRPGQRRRGSVRRPYRRRPRRRIQDRFQHSPTMGGGRMGRLRPRFMRHFWTRASIYARSARCTASWTLGKKFASDATNCDTRPTTSLNWWPPLPIRSGHGTSPSSWGRRNGRTSTFT